MANNLGTLTISIAANSSLFTRELSKAERETAKIIQKFDKQARAATSNFSRNFSNINKQVVGFQRNFGQAASDIAKATAIITGAFAAGAASVSGFLATYQAVTDQLSVTAAAAERLNFTPEFFSALELGARGSGLSIEVLIDGLRQFNTFIQQGESNGGAFVSVLEGIGLSVSEVLALQPEQRIKAIADGLATLTSNSEKLGAGARIFGESGSGFVSFLGQGSQQIEALEAQVNSLGIALNRTDLLQISQARSEISDLGFVTTSVIERIVANLSPLIGALAETQAEGLRTAVALTQTFDDLPETIATVLTFVESIGSGLVNVFSDFRAVGSSAIAFILEQLESGVQIGESIIQGFVNTIRQAARVIFSIINNLIDAFETRINRPIAILNRLGAEIETIDLSAGVEGVIEGLDQQIDFSTGLAEILAEDAKTFRDRQALFEAIADDLKSSPQETILSRFQENQRAIAEALGEDAGLGIIAPSTENVNNAKEIANEQQRAAQALARFQSMEFRQQLDNDRQLHDLRVDYLETESRLRLAGEFGFRREITTTYARLRSELRSIERERLQAQSAFILQGFQARQAAQVAPGGNASGVLGITGNTGFSTGPHLDLRVPGGGSNPAGLIDRFLIGGQPLSNFPVTSGFGATESFRSGPHRGIDFGIATGQTITAVVPVENVELFHDPGGGGWITEVTFMDGLVAQLLHLDPSSQGRVSTTGTGRSSSGSVNLPTALPPNPAVFNAQNALLDFEREAAITEALNAQTNAYRGLNEEIQFNIQILQSQLSLQGASAEQIQQAGEIQAQKLEIDRTVAAHTEEMLSLLEIEPELVDQVNASITALNESAAEYLETQQEQAALQQELNSLIFSAETIEEYNNKLLELNALNQAYSEGRLRLTETEQLLLSIQQQGIVLNDQQIAQITNASQAYETLQISMQQTAGDMQALQNLGQQVGSSIENSFVNAFTAVVVEGESFGEAMRGLLNSVLSTLAQVFIRLVLLRLIPGGGGLGGIFGGLFGSFQTGTDYVPRTGPYLLHQGEQVIPAGQNRGVNINVQNFTGANVDTREGANGDVNIIITRAVEASRQAVQNDFSRSLDRGQGVYSSAITRNLSTNRRQ